METLLARISTTRRRATAATAVVMFVALALAAPAAYANFKSMSQRLPASSNAIVAANVEKLLETPFAKSEQWAQTTAAAWANQPMMIPPGSKRLLMAAEVKPSTMEPTWELSLMELDEMPTVQALAEAEGGHIDRVWDKDAVASPINAYFVPLDSTLLASITPAERSAIARWIRTPAGPDGNVTSEYIKSVLASLDDETDIVMAMDLEGAFGVPIIRRWLDDAEIKGVESKQLDEVARTLGTMKGITLRISVNEDVKGKAIVDFGRDTTALRSCAQPIMVEFLNTAGMRIDDVKDWTFVATGKQVTMDGKLSAAALRQLLGMVQSPIPAATVTQKPAGGASAAPTTPAQASQRYYKVVCANLDNFKGGASPAETATWARTTSKRIDQLPILNVDPALVEWGTAVSTKLKQAASVLGVGQTQMNARVAGVADPTYGSYSYDGDGNYSSHDGSAQRAAYENARRQRRQASLEQKAQAQEQALQFVNEIAGTRTAVRAAMVEKYQVEF
jgi:hypothetical protein